MIPAPWTSSCPTSSGSLLADYFALIASKGYVVIGPRYSLAPEHHYPTPLRQVMRNTVGFVSSTVIAAMRGISGMIVLSRESAG